VSLDNLKIFALISLSVYYCVKNFDKDEPIRLNSNKYHNLSTHLLISFLCKMSAGCFVGSKYLPKCDDFPKKRLLVPHHSLYLCYHPSSVVSDGVLYLQGAKCCDVKGHT